MKKLIKRADGSKSPRGLWDNIRANKGSGKKPTKEMLKQEAKIKKEEDMNMEYKKGGKKNSAKAKVMKEAKREKESFITESKELKFGAPSNKSPMKYEMGGPKKGEPSKSSPDSTAYYKQMQEFNYKQAETNAKFGLKSEADANMKTASQALKDELRQKNKGKTGYDKDGYPLSEPKGIYPNPKNPAKEAMDAFKIEKKMGGKKTMEPGGGGRFAKMVNKMKGQGKSEESAKAIAASVGRKKYGKSKFQEMAAAGKKKMGGKKC